MQNWKNGFVFFLISVNCYAVTICFRIRFFNKLAGIWISLFLNVPTGIQGIKQCTWSSGSYSPQKNTNKYRAILGTWILQTPNTLDCRKAYRNLLIKRKLSCLFHYIVVLNKYLSTGILWNSFMEYKMFRVFFLFKQCFISNFSVLLGCVFEGHEPKSDLK